MALVRQSGFVYGCGIVAILTVLFSAGLARGQVGTITHYRGMAEASAAAVLDSGHFVVAEDECNTLLIYRFGHEAPVGKPIDLANFLKTGDKASDLEAAARIGKTIFWISSHSLPKSGKAREWRRRFFATEVVTDIAASPTLRPVGQPFAGLIDAMAKAPQLAALKLSEAATLPPEQPGGLNIEGLAEWNGGLLIGLRNPLRAGGKAPLIPLLNPDAVILAKELPKFGDPILLDLGGRGIRSIERTRDGYLIVAGPVADVGAFALFRWNGNAKDGASPSSRIPPVGLVPEAAIAVPNSHRVMLLSDDGARNREVACGAAMKMSQTFRALILEAP